MHPIRCCIVSVGDLEARPKRRRAETIERLLDAALETFAEIGFAAASVEDICRRGGFTRGAFYSSFRTKDELFAALFARETGRDLARAEEQLTGIEQEADPVAFAVERCLSTFRADRTWVLVLTEYRLHAARHPEAAAALQEHAAELRTRLTGLIEGAVARSGVRLALPVGELAGIVAALHDGVVIAHLPGGGPLHATDSPDLERTALMLLLRAAVSHPAPTD